MSLIKLTKNSQVYIVCPPYKATGGPEDIQILCKTLRDFSIDAKIYYYPLYNGDPIHPQYKKFGNPFVNEVEDKEENILIVPESFYLKGICKGRYPKLLERYKKIQKVIWWLSWDFFFVSLIPNPMLWFLGGINKILSNFGITIDYYLLAKDWYRNYDITKDKYLRQADIHLAHGYYVLDNLRKKGISNVEYLSDHLSDEFLNASPSLNSKERENIVLYNPRKGYGFTQKIISKAKGIKFVPIQGMSQSQVIEIMKKAKVYIDFGNHPGKDHLPREAGICGCCVITSTTGSAAFKEDVPIPDEFKIPSKVENIDIIISKISQCLKNYDEEIKKFEGYRKFAKEEKERFVQDVKRIFL